MISIHKILLTTIITIVCCSFLPAGHFEKTNSGGNIFVTSSTGDLNKDGLKDSVVVLQNKSVDPSRYLLKVFFKQSSGKYQLAVSSDSAIDVQYANSGDRFESIEIKNNVLRLNVELLRGHTTHVFRYQNGHFELIGYDFTMSDGAGFITSLDFNLSTGKYIYQRENYETGKVTERKDTVIKIRPLPSLQRYNAERTSFFFDR